MQSLPDAPLTAQVTPGLLPRFQDGSINMQELIRQPAESMANEAMSAEADESCGGGTPATATASARRAPAWAR